MKKSGKSKSTPKSIVKKKSNARLQSSHRNLKVRLEEAEETLRAITSGEVDAFIVQTGSGQQVFTLRNADHPYRIMVEAMNEGAATLLLDGTIIYCNQQLADLLKRESSDIPGHFFGGHVARRDLQAFEAAFTQAKTRPSKVEVFLTSSEGALIATQISMAAVDLDGTYAISIVVTDLTEHKQNEALIVSEKMTRSILEQAAEAIIVCDERGFIIRANPAAHRLAGQNLLARGFQDSFQLRRNDGSFFSLESISSIPLKAEVESFEQKTRGVAVSFQRADGQSFALKMSVSHLRNSDVGLGFVFTLTDITAQKRQEIELKAAKESAESASSLKTAFLANMSHEIRTPLGAILGFTEMLKDPDISPRDRAEYLEIISRSGTSLTRLIDDILDLSKVEAGRLDVERIRFSLSDLVNEVISMFSEKAKKKGVDLNVRSHDDVPEFVKTDPTRLRQILVNVIGNAVKFTQQGRVELQITEDLEKDGGRSLIFKVSDTGTGLTHEQSARLFEPFSQGDNSTTRKFGGTGLGLVLSRRLARALGGDVTLESTIRGEGSVFCIRVEYEPVAVEKIAKAVGKTVRESGAQALKGVRVLVVEDSLDNQVLLERLLARSGASVELASNGREGVNLARGGKFDVVLMDIQMPVLDGYAATKELRSGGYRKPIIALTAYAMEEERQRCLSIGCDAHLSKPISASLLAETVSAMAAKSRREKTGFADARPSRSRLGTSARPRFSEKSGDRGADDDGL